MPELELSEQKEQAREMWGGGDYAAIVDNIAAAGRKAVEAAAIAEGDEVLDVACGTGNATIPAAQAGAKVTGLDLTPELLEAGRAGAAETGVEIEWVEGDAENLPFEDESFDVVISVFGSMFAPDQKRTAGEIARVLRPGGRMAICAWTPDGSIGRFFRLMADHMPPPPEGFQPPVLWGTEDHVLELFDGTGMELSFERAEVIFEGDSTEEFLAEYENKLPPMVAAKGALEPEGKWDAVRTEVLALYEEVNESDGNDLRFPGEYLVTTGTKG
jgi:ubiquinone/menaquinone biosynthesis C-methylase UbiE